MASDRDYKVVSRDSPRGVIVRVTCSSRTGCKESEGAYEGETPSRSKRTWARSADGKLYCPYHRGEAKRIP